MVQTSTQPDALLKWMASLADATRLRLLSVLERHELGVSDLCDVVQMPQSTVSRHLKLLGDEGWLASRRVGTTNLYSMVLDELSPAQRKLWLLAREQSRDWATIHQDEIRLMRRLSDRRSQSRAFFAGAAGEWDRMRDELYGSSFTRQAVAALLPATWTVADLGCGTGLLASEMGRSVAQVIGIDNSPAMLKAAKQRCEQQPNVELRRGDLEALPIDDDACDAALLVLVLTYVNDANQVLSEMQRILKPGGKAVIVDLLRHDRDDFRRQMGQQSMGFETKELRQMLTTAGFDSITCEPLPPEPQAKGPALLLATGTVNAR